MSFTRRFLDPPEPDTHPLCNECEEICDGVNPCQRVVDAMEANEKVIREHEDKYLDERWEPEI